MKARILLPLLCTACLALGCGPRKTAAPVSLTRDFPHAEIPSMVSDPNQRMSWLVQHFWDRYTATDSLYYSDSVTVNGVTLENLEKQVGVFATLLQEEPLAEGEAAMTALYRRMEAFQLCFPEANLLPELTALVGRYFYDPNSPVRSEELYLPFARCLAASELLEPLSRERYAREARLCALNRPGTPAANFSFVDSFGKKRTLYGIKAELTLLIFGHPDCQACRELQAVMEENEALSQAIASGELKVVDIYIDEDIDAWKAHVADYPASWINGYDPGFVIRTELLYDVRAVPSLYLLSQDKTVLLKDATPESFFAALGFAQ